MVYVSVKDSTTLGIMAFSITTLSITTLRTLTLSIKGLFATLSINYTLY